MPRSWLSSECLHVWFPCIQYLRLTQTPLSWRHIIPLLKDKFSTWAPELPGYGLSSIPPSSDTRTVGHILIDALREIFPHQSIIWCGHDRGARIGHRLLVDKDPPIVASVLIDIVPTVEQWKSFSSPLASVAYHHWPFLAAPTTPRLISLMSGREYCLNRLKQAHGKSEEGTSKFQENNAIEHYCALFDKQEAIDGSCADYAAASTVDYEAQRKDQEAGRNISTATCVIYSVANLGKMHDVEKVWKYWVHGGMKFQCIGIGDQYGHYLAEECPDRIAKIILDWLEGLNDG
ncbi:alpha/beta-hydrolase [Piedraia hortae CBS 480.64]|uniref:Alpha/beta-hydrolase n=1 Tax=Piedraia hortae CBS 480.64 TaxID=1314780 RepID=A0A6A7C7J2_9PEZI|nr:alpha/beta-hydrolase [Piedraia hortae CBS 480.64]